MTKNKKSLYSIMILSAFLTFLLVSAPSGNALTSTTAKTDALLFLSNVASIDTSKYNITLVSDKTPYNVVNSAGQEQIRYKLENTNNALDATWLFNNGKLVWFTMSVISGSPVFTKIQSADLIVKANSVLDNYANYTGSSRFQVKKDTLGTVSTPDDTTVTVGNTKLAIFSDGFMKGFGWTNYNGINGPGFSIEFANGTLVSLDDHESLFTVGSTALNVNVAQAIGIALDEIKTFSWTVGADAKPVTNFTVVSKAVQAKPIMQVREDSTLYPFWRVEVPVDKFYVGNTLYYTNSTSIVVGVWADTGAISYSKALSYGGSMHDMSDSSQLTIASSPQSISSSTSPQPDNNKVSPSSAGAFGAVALIVAIAVVALIVRKRSK